MSLTYYLIFVVALLTHEIDCYYLNQKLLTWNQAQSYCQLHCKSELASIHSIEDNTFAIHIMNYTTKWKDSLTDTSTRDHFNNLKSRDIHVWIGLHDATPNNMITEWQWSDGSNVNYGTTMGQYPWNPNVLPSSIPNAPCVRFDEKDHEWINDDCNTQHLSLCNSCDSTFNKYLVIEDAMQWTGQFTDRPNCNIYFDTIAASIHSQEDYDEAVLLSMQIYSSTLWTGLNDRTTQGVSLFEWRDGTTWDFATTVSPQGSYPWESGQPDNFLGSWGVTDDCVWIDKDTGLLDDIFCTHMLDPHYAYALCNAPTDICYQETWEEVLSDPSMTTSDICEFGIQGNVNPTKQILSILGNKQWLNHGQTLRIHYMIEIQYTAIGNTGLVIDYVSQTMFYYAGIAIDSTNYKLFFGQMKDGVYSELAQTPIIFSLNAFYQMEVEVTYDNTFTVSINGYSVSYTDHLRPNSMFSGYIGIQNTGLNIRTKSLFVSGTQVHIASDSDLTTMSIPTAQPTVSPTAQPTVSPTVQPTAQPSVSPTLKPTATPTRTPTVLPTLNPILGSISPSAVPSAAPVSHSSGSSTTNPSAYPTSLSGNPSTHPARSLSVHPTSYPSIAPISHSSDASVNPSPAPTSSSSHPSAEPSPHPSVTASTSWMEVSERFTQSTEQGSAEDDAQSDTKTVDTWRIVEVGIGVIVIGLFVLLVIKYRKPQKKAAKTIAHLEMTVHDTATGATTDMVPGAQAHGITVTTATLDVPTVPCEDKTKDSEIALDKTKGSGHRLSHSEELYDAGDAGCDVTAGATAGETVGATTVYGTTNCGEGAVEGLSDYQMIKEVWVESNVDDWEEYLQTFIEQQVTDEVLQGLTKEDEDWKLLISKIGPRRKFQKIWFQKNQQ